VNTPIHNLISRVLFDPGTELHSYMQEQLLQYHTAHHAEVNILQITATRQIR